MYSHWQKKKLASPSSTISTSTILEKIQSKDKRSAMLRLKLGLRWLCLAWVTAVLAGGCGFATQKDATKNQLNNATDPAVSSDCRTINHSSGETEVCGQPQKIVAITTHVLDLLLSLDEQPAGYSAPVNMSPSQIFDNPAWQIPYLGDYITTQPVNLGSVEEPSIERLTALNPDLILSSDSSATEYNLLSQIAPTLLLKDPIAKHQWKDNLQTIATALGKSEQGETLIQQRQAKIDQVRLDLADIVAEHPNLLVLSSHRLEEGVFLVQADSYLGEILESVGFKLISPDNVSGPQSPISLEALPTMNEADTIIILGFNLDVQETIATAEKPLTEVAEEHQVQAIQKSWEENALAQSLTASQENRVYFATYMKWQILNGPIGTDLVLDQLQQFFLDEAN